MQRKVSVFFTYILNGDNFSFRLLLTKICSPEANNWAIKCNAQRSQVFIPTSDYQVSDIKHSAVCSIKMKHFPIFSYNWRNQTISLGSDQHSDLYRHLSSIKALRVLGLLQIHPHGKLLLAALGSIIFVKSGCVPLKWNLSWTPWHSPVCPFFHA